MKNLLMNVLITIAYTIITIALCIGIDYLYTFILEQMDLLDGHLTLFGWGLYVVGLICLAISYAIYRLAKDYPYSLVLPVCLLFAFSLYCGYRLWIVDAVNEIKGFSLIGALKLFLPTAVLAGSLCLFISERRNAK